MKNFEFISYKKYPDDPYTNAIARVRVDKKHVLVFAHKKTKNGGFFWAAPSVTLVEDGEKKYLSAHKMDSEVEQEMLLEFIEESVKQLGRKPKGDEKMTYPHGLVAPGESKPDIAPFGISMDEVANQQEIPF